MKIQILVDNPNSWIIPYVDLLQEKMCSLGHHAIILHEHSEVVEGDVLCLLACEKVFKNLHLNRYNLVVHESELPKGKGWSPVSWQVLEGKTKIPVTLFEASEGVDSGDIYLQEFIDLNGTELLPEIKHKQGLVTNDLIIRFITASITPKGRKQEGESSFYAKRGPADSELDINKTILEQFNLLKICDNERYPAFVVVNGVRYILKIEKDA